MVPPFLISNFNHAVNLFYLHLFFAEKVTDAADQNRRNKKLF